MICVVLSPRRPPACPWSPPLPWAAGLVLWLLGAGLGGRGETFPLELAEIRKKQVKTKEREIKRP